MADESVVLTEIIDAVALITLNRPGRSNAWTLEMDEGYRSALQDVDADPTVRAVVLTGAGRAFSAGADIDVLRGMLEGGPRVTAQTGVAVLPGLSVHKPLIAAINGACAGLALVHAMCCDVRFMAASAKLSTAFVRRGLVAEHGISWLLTHTIGVQGAMDLLLSGRPITGDEALRMGLVARVAPTEELLPSALAYAHDLAANCSPTAMRLIKQQVRQDPTRSLTEAVEEADGLMDLSFASSDFREGVLSLIEKRPPAFEQSPDVG